MNLIKKLNEMDKNSKYNRWVEKKINAYGWRGFLATLMLLGSGYLIFLYSPEIIVFFGSEELLPEQKLTHEARVYMINKLAPIILALMVAKLVRQYTSKEEREAHQEKMRKDALMEAEILERKQEKNQETQNQ